jgi:hypothetical protein
LLVYLSSVLPTSKLSLLALASAIIPLSIITTGVKNSVMVYASSSLLCFVLGLRGMALAYTLFFGLYSLAKYYIERLQKLTLEYLLKLLFFNVSFLIIYYFYKTLFTDMISIQLSFIYVLLAGQVVFLIYDYALTIIITYISRRFKTL